MTHIPQTTHTACPWCGFVFKPDDKPLKHHETGNRYCDRDCFEMDQRFAREFPKKGEQS